MNISESLKTGTEVIDSVITKQTTKDTYSHLYYLPDGKFAAHTVVSFESGVENEPPDYYIGDAVTNQLTDTLKLYKDMIYVEPNQDMYLQTNDAIKPDLSKIVIAMQFIPHIAIVDLETKEVRGVDINNGIKFEPNNLSSCFCSVDVNDEYIYALLTESKVGLNADQSGVMPPVLYIFDWDGNLLNRYKFKNLDINEIAIDRSGKSNVIYGADFYSDKVYKFDPSKVE